MRRKVVGAAVGITSALVLGVVMLPVRAHISIATAALVLVIPVVAGAAIGGFTSGVVSVAAGFLAYDVWFIPPYGTLDVGSAQHWVALGIYVVVMAIVARLVTHLTDAREAARARAASARHLLDLSELLLAEGPGLRNAIVAAVGDAFGIDGVALLEPVAGRLEVVASSGSPLDPEELARMRPEAQLPVPLSMGSSHEQLQTLALSSSGRPVGLLVLRNAPPTRPVREALPILANHLAVALERSALHERVLRAELLEEVDRLRQSLVGAVSHDLRTPLASIKVASSTLVESSDSLSEDDARELHQLIDLQVDRLTMLVNNLLDMTRIQAGAFEVRRKAVSVHELVDDTVGAMRTVLAGRVVRCMVDDDVPLVDADATLVGQVLANLLDNAHRHAPAGTPITVTARPDGAGRMVVSVSDLGPGVPPEEREAVFEQFVRFDTGGRSGLGLAIARAFVRAHGEEIWAEERPPGSGATFTFTLPVALDGEAS
jgi:two-component system sensor histidine kinase KdpD